MNTYLVEYGLVIEVEAENEDEAIEKANEAANIEDAYIDVKEL